jgi:hypothetical protein
MTNGRVYSSLDRIHDSTGKFAVGWSTRVGNKCICRFCEFDINLRPKLECPHLEHLNSYERSKKYALLNYHNNRETRLNRNERIAIEVLVHYGGKCSCCGFDDLNKKINYVGYSKRFLCIDVIAGGGSKLHRQTHNLHKWLKANNYPNGFRVLCAACNVSMEPNETVCEWHKWHGEEK